MSEKTSLLRRCTDKLFGGLPMSWPVVILFAVAAALLTFAFLVIPVFSHTSFQRVGETMEAWVFFAIIIMTNCKKPMESALKTFVFFLISQPLIYLLQVPFSWMGWGLFQYYTYWFVLTLFTFPAALIGWYIKKKNWLSLLILSPMLVLLTITYASAFQTAVKQFPRLIVTAVFCLAQVMLYLYAFTGNIWQKLTGFFVPLAAVIIMAAVQPAFELNTTLFLPDDPILTDDAVVVMADDVDMAHITIEKTGEDSMIRVQCDRTGTSLFEIVDGDRTYRYEIKIFGNGNQAAQVEIIPQESSPDE